MPQGRHICAKASDVVKVRMCIYLQSDHAIPHWKCILWCCAECPHINLIYQETDKKHKRNNPLNTVSNLSYHFTMKFSW